MSEQSDQLNIYQHDAYRNMSSIKTEATEFSGGDRLDFRKASPNLGPVLDSLNRVNSPAVSPTEKLPNLAEKSVEYISSVGHHLELVRRDFMDKNWSLEEDAYNTAHLDDQQKVA